LLNEISSNFFELTFASVESAYVRPRYAGYIGLQRAAGEPIADFLRYQITAVEALQRMDRLYRNSLTDSDMKRS
jgi:multiple sugar transport system substrate-binding protein